MTQRILLLEHASPVMAPPSAWKVEMVKPEPFGEDLIESYIAESENRFAKLTESLLMNETLTEEQVRAVLAEFKDGFAHELREAHSHKRMRVSGPAQIEDQKNGNGRVYPSALWDNVLGESSDFTERLNNRQVLGELEHPTEGNTKLPRVSHLVEKVWRKEGVVFAQHLLFHTPNGKIIEELYKSGAVPGVSSRGAGSTRNVNGVDVVEASDFHLDTWDFVAQPSVATARPSTVGESSTGQKAAPVSERVNFQPTFVNPSVPQGGEPNMTQLRESTETLLTARTALSASESYLNGGDTNLAGLLEQQQTVVSALSGMGRRFPDEMSNEATEIRAKLGEHASTLRREIQRTVAEAEDEGDGDGKPKKGVNPFAKKDSDGDDDGSPPDEKKEQLAGRIDATESLERMTGVDIIEALAARNAKLVRQTEGQVPVEKYRVAVELGEAVVARANRDGKVYETRLNEMETKLTEATQLAEASRTLLEATISRYRGEKVGTVVEKLIAGNPRLKAIEGRLRECQDMGTLKALVESTIKPLVEGTLNNRTDLPPVTHQALTERVDGNGTSPATGVTQTSGGQENLMEMLTSDKPQFG